MTSSASTLGNLGSDDDFYDVAPLEPHLIYQGEILADVPILSIAKANRLAVTPHEKRQARTRRCSTGAASVLSQGR